MQQILESIYKDHHTARRGDGFALLGDVRGPFLRNAIGNGKKVLDIGCRDGALTSTFAAGNMVTGLDIDTNALHRAQEKLGIDTKQVDLNGEWGILAGTYDAVVAAEVLEHLYYPNVVIQKVADVLTPEGLFVGTVPNAFSLRHRLRYVFKQKRGTPLEDPTHINHFTVRELHSMLCERFEEVTIFGYGRLGWLARTFPQSFAFGLMWAARYPRQ